MAVQRVSGEPLSLVTENLTGISPIPVLPEERQAAASRMDLAGWPYLSQYLAAI
jgi:hypothetical protein